MNLRIKILLPVLVILLFSGCGLFTKPVPTSTAAAGDPPTPIQVNRATITATFTAKPRLPAQPTSTPTASITPSATPTIEATITPTATLAPTETYTNTPVPTYVKLRGKVIIDQAVCHYGPGAPYLYKYGVYKGSNLEIIRRIELGNYIEIQAIGGNNPCWVREDYLEIQGDLANVQPVSAEDVKLPMSPYYGPLTGVSATRNGSEVTVTWHPLLLRPGDDSEQTPYVVEAWVCKDGQMAFLPVGSYQTAVKITDEPGCSTPSHARVYAAEKHGYTRWVKVPWPTHP